jgi:hypothetical protein
MGKHLAVICQPEVLGPAYLTGKRHVALNLAIAVVDGAADEADRRLVRPWYWQKVPFVMLIAERADGSFGPPAILQPLEAPDPLPIIEPPPPPGEPAPAPPATPDEQKRNLREGADAIVDRHDLVELTWVHQPGEQQGSERHLPSLLMDMSRWPAPLPQQLNLTYYVVVDESFLGGASQFHAALAFVDRDGSEHKPKDPVASPGSLRPDATQPDMYVWDYETGAGTPDEQVAGYARPLDATQTADPAESLIDLDRLWIRARLDGASGGTWHATDWAGELPERMAEALDAAGRLYEFGQRLAGMDPASPVRAALERRDTGAVWGRTWLRRAGLRALRRYAHIGRRVGPDGFRLIDTLQQDYQEIVGSPIPAEIVAAVEGYDNLIDDELTKTSADPSQPNEQGFLRWRTLLGEVVGGTLAGSDVLLRSPLDPPAGSAGAGLPPLSDDLTALNGLITAVRDARVLLRLMLTMWRWAVQKMLPDQPSFAAAWPEIEQSLERRVLPRYNLRRRLGLASAGASIGDVFRALGDVKGDELGTLRRRFVAVHEASVRADLNADHWFDALPDGGSGSVRSDVIKLFQEIAGDFAERVAERQLFPTTPDAEAGDVRPAEQPHRIGFQIDRLAADTDRDKARFDDDDFLRRMAGVCVFLRQAKPRRTAAPQDADFESWRSLNMAKLSILTAIDDGEPIYKPVSGASIVAYGVPYRDGVRKAFIYYDNAPLIARAKAMTSTGLQVSERSDGAAAKEDENDGNMPLLCYEATWGSPWALEIPCLRFGQVYEAVCAAIPNAGALPRGWTRNSTAVHPAVMAADSTALGESDMEDGDKRRVRYLRRVRVGQFRVKGERTTVRSVATDEPAQSPETELPLRPMFDSFDSYTRPAGLRAGEPAEYYRHEETGRPQLALAGTRWRLAITAIQAEALGKGTVLTVAVLDGSGSLFSATLSGGGAEPYRVEVRVGQETRSQTLPDGGDALIDLVLEGESDAVGEDPDAAVPTTLRAGLHATGAHPRAADLVSVTGDAPPAAGVYVRVDGTGGLNFDRPLVRVGADTIPPETAGDLPRILLTPVGWQVNDAASYRFEVRTPTADAATWDRWRAMDEWLARGTTDYDGIRNERADVLADHRDELRKPVPDLGRILLDDPAVARRLMIEMVPVFTPTRRPPSRKFLDVAQPPKDPDNPFAFWQAPPIVVSCAVMSSAGEPLIELPTMAHSELLIRVPEGEIWEARLSSLVETKFFYDGATDAMQEPGRFPARVREGLPTVVDGSKSYIAVAPYRWVLEGATARMPRADDLWRALACRQVGSWVRATLEPAAAATWDAFVYIGKVEIKRQLWRWEGRPIAVTVPPSGLTQEIDVAFPYGRTPANIDTWENGGRETALLWDAIGFANREDDDFVRSHRFAELAPAATTLYERDITGDRRAQYYRFAVVAASRYAGLIPRNATGALATARDGIQALHPDWDANVDPNTPVESLRSPWPWRRLFVPCRREPGEQLPEPKVKFVVPLTTRDDKGQLPGLLVVLDEPWFDIGGLPEGLLCEVARVPAREKGSAGGSDADPFAYVYPGLPLCGPDPMLHTGHWLDYSSAPPPGSEIGETLRLKFDVRGPIGYTFDREASAPRFVATSFFLEPGLYDRSGNPDPSTLPWAFAALQFRRVIRAEGRGLSDDLVSEPTAPYWHQLLPDASRFQVKLVDGAGRPIMVERSAKDIIAAVDETTGRLRFLVDHDGRRIDGVPQPAPQGGWAQHRLFALITRRIYNMWGERKDESYIGVVPLDGGAAIKDIASSLTGFGGGRPLAGEQSLRLRLLEIQYNHKDASNECLARALNGDKPELLWDALFPPEQNLKPLGIDAMARILRVSCPLCWQAGAKPS